MAVPPVKEIFQRGEVKDRVRLSAGQVLQFIVDALVLAVAFYLAYQIRFEFRLATMADFAQNMCKQLPWVVLLQWVLLFAFGAYRRLWRFFGMEDLPPFLMALPLFAGVLAMGRVLLHPIARSPLFFPYSIIVLNLVLALGGVVGIRLIRRFAFERSNIRRSRAQCGKCKATRVLLLGAGVAGVMAARELNRQGSVQQKVVGFLDDDPEKKNTMIAGVRVLGRIEDVGRIARKRHVDEAIITIANTSRERIGRIVRICEKAHVKTRIIPALHEIISGARSIAAIRDVDIADLLGRDVIVLDAKPIEDFVMGKRVLVTGAGGSIGSELVRQLAGFSPKQLALLDQSEFAVYEIHREMARRFPELPLEAIVADVTMQKRMEAVFAQFRPEVVIHAAAYKHVPLMEANEREAVANNIFGTRVTAGLAGAHHANVFVLISTDKAVNPTSVMGASKRVAELVVQEQAALWPETTFVSVRFGNVLGSAGSVIPLFREQIAAGGPVTVTHPDMLRYFMTIPEASRLVLQAASIGRGGEIFVLDMGEPVRIDQLAREMIELSGLRPDVDIPIQYTGLRPGEKMFEELNMASENATRTRHPKIFIGKTDRPDETRLQQGLDALWEYAGNGDAGGIRRCLAELVPEATLTLPE